MIIREKRERCSYCGRFVHFECWLRDTSPLDVAHFLSLHPIVRPISFTARRLALMSSRDSVGGGPYVLEAAYPLGPSYPNRPMRGDHQRR